MLGMCITTTTQPQDGESKEPNLMRRSCSLLARPCRRRHDLLSPRPQTTGSSTSLPNALEQLLAHYSSTLLTQRRSLSTTKATTAARIATALTTTPLAFTPETSGNATFSKAPTASSPATQAQSDPSKNGSIMPMPRGLLTLAIESSCDDTCIAILGTDRIPWRDSDGTTTAATLYFNEKITADNRSFRGVYPEASVQSHVSSMAPLLKRALAALPPSTAATSTGGGFAASEAVEGPSDHDDGGPGGNSSRTTVWAAGSVRRKPDFVAVTRGPGMLSNLTVGLMTAKSLAVAWDVPLLAVNHMEAHALTPRLVHALEQGKAAASVADEKLTGPASSMDRKTDGENTISSFKPEFPFLSLLVSGGHSLLVHSRGLADHSILAEATNIAIGDLLDKCARVILPESYIDAATDVMYGRLLEEFAFPAASSSSDPPHRSEFPAAATAGGQHHDGLDTDHDYEYTPPATRRDEQRPYISPTRGWSLTPPMHESAAMQYDFSGLNGRVKAIMSADPAVFPGGGDAAPLGLEDRRELARHTMRIAFEHLASRLIMALKSVGETKPVQLKGRQQQQQQQKKRSRPAGEVKTVVVSGGVASNKYLRHILRSILDARGFGDVEITCPPVALCTDNAAMIAWAGAEMYEAGWRSELDVRPIKKWPLDAQSGTGGGGGVLGVPGWYKEVY